MKRYHTYVDQNARISVAVSSRQLHEVVTGRSSGSRAPDFKLGARSVELCASFCLGVVKSYYLVADEVVAGSEVAWKSYFSGGTIHCIRYKMIILIKLELYTH